MLNNAVVLFLFYLIERTNETAELFLQRISFLFKKHLIKISKRRRQHFFLIDIKETYAVESFHEYFNQV